MSLQAPPNTSPQGRISIDCPVCDEGSGRNPLRDEMLLRDAFSRDEFPLAKCTTCSCLFLREGPSIERLPAYYSTAMGIEMRKKSSSLFDSLRRFQLMLEARVFEKALSKLAFIADLGAGDGSFISFLKERGFSTQAVDQGPPAEWPYPEIPYLQSDLHGSRFQPSSLIASGRTPDLVILRHVLEHVYEPKLLLRNLHEANVENLWIVVPNAESRLRSVFGRYWFMWDPPRHLTHFTLATLTEMLRSSGYRAEITKSYGIDEVVSSLYRYLKIRFHGRPAAWVELFKPKGPVAALSSALAAVLRMNTAVGVLARRVSAPQ